MVYGETGCMPTAVDIRQRAAAFWLKTSHGSIDTLVSKLSHILVKMDASPHYNSPYLTYIRKTFDDLGLTYLSNIHRPSTNLKHEISNIKTRAKDQFVQSWEEMKNNSNKASFYKMFKNNFGT